MDGKELEDKIEIAKKAAKNKYNPWTFGFICRLLPTNVTKIMELEIKFQEYAGTENSLPSCRVSVLYKGKEVLCMSDSSVDAYISGEWEKFIPILVEKANKEENRRNNRKKNTEEKEKMELLKTEARRFGIEII